MINISYTNTSESRTSVVKYISNQKTCNANYQVIDVGGGVTSWTKDVADMVADINVQATERSIPIDVCNESDWQRLMAYAARHGKFNYAICTHTLEDVYNPFPALKYLPQIAHAGVIITPSLQAELSYVENVHWKGYIHHRWIFESDDNHILLVPKISLIENLVDFVEFNPHKSEIRFDWNKDINFKVFMDNYLGPNAKAIVDQYTQLISRKFKENDVKHTMNHLTDQFDRQALKWSRKIGIWKKMMQL